MYSASYVALNMAQGRPPHHKVWISAIYADTASRAQHSSVLASIIEVHSAIVTLRGRAQSFLFLQMARTTMTDFPGWRRSH